MTIKTQSVCKCGLPEDHCYHLDNGSGWFQHNLVAEPAPTGESATVFEELRAQGHEPPESVKLVGNRLPTESEIEYGKQLEPMARECLEGNKARMTSAELTCGKPAASLIPRWGMSWACVLQPNHEGECAPGGNCVKHGKYICKPNEQPKCPKWPDCIPAAAPQPVSGDAPPYAQDLPYLLQAADDVLAEQSLLNQKFTDKQNDLFTALMPWRNENGKFEAAQIKLDAPKVEEITTQEIGDIVTRIIGNWPIDVILPSRQTITRIVKESRPYFPPASQTEPVDDGRRYCKHCTNRIYFDCVSDSLNPKWRHIGSNFVECFGDLDTWAEPIYPLATPASTARTDGQQWTMKPCPKEFAAIMSSPADWLITSTDGATLYLSNDELDKMAKGHLQLVPLPAAPGSVPPLCNDPDCGDCYDKREALEHAQKGVPQAEREEQK